MAHNIVDNGSPNWDAVDDGSPDWDNDTSGDGAVNNVTHDVESADDAGEVYWEDADIDLPGWDLVHEAADDEVLCGDPVDTPCSGT